MKKLEVINQGHGGNLSERFIAILAGQVPEQGPDLAADDRQDWEETSMPARRVTVG